jgi:hypothetical protein
LFFAASKVTSEKQLTGKILVKSKNNQFKVTVAYRAKLLTGRFRYPPEKLHFLTDGGRTNETNVTRHFELTNEFQVPVFIKNVTMDDVLHPYFSVRSRVLSLFFSSS